MRLDFSNIKTLVLNCKDDSSRRQHISTQLSKCEIAFEIVEGIRCQPGFIGCALSHLKAISHLALEPPFMIIEDDCSVTQDYQQVLDVPDRADLVYLGVSKWGMIPGSSKGVYNTTVATRYNNTFLQVHNMLSAHAIIYLSERVLAATRTCIIKYVLDSLPHDIGLARLQREFIALTPNRPFFYQDANYGGQQKGTDTILQAT